MPNINEKTLANPFYKARSKAAKRNDTLSSRDNAAEMMGIDKGRLFKIENDLANPYPDEVQMMALLYGEPYLRNHYCTKCCPLGGNVPEVVEPADLDRITVKALATLRKVNSVKEDLLTITEDGIIDDQEKPILDNIIETLDELNKVTAHLKNWVEKNG